ncbi:MAG: TatD family hydrolase [Nanoarchaeota archaeon]
MYIDLHCHLDLFSEDEIKKIIFNAKYNNVNTIINNGLCLKSNMNALKLSSKYETIKTALGFYPIDALNLEKENMNENNHNDGDNVNNNYNNNNNNNNNLKKNINNYKQENNNYQEKNDFDQSLYIKENINFIKKNIKKISAIGEVGLDYKNGKNKKLQMFIFKQMIELAIKHDLPLIIHSRKAELDVIEILEKYDYKKIILHCFSGKKKLLLRAIKNNWYFTIPTAIVKATQYQEMVKLIPLNKLFCETDSPFMSPFVDKKNEPMFVIESYKMISKIKNLELIELKNAIYMNYQKLF